MVKKIMSVIIATLLGFILIGNVYGLVRRKTGQTVFPMFLGVRCHCREWEYGSSN